MDSAEFGFKLSQEFGKYSFDGEPVNDNYASYGNFQIVGHGKVTNGHCGTFAQFYGCSRVELHDKVTLDGKSWRNKVFMRPVFNSCGKPSCPICYKYGWAVKQAGKIEMRLKEASKRFGVIEHIVASVPVKDYGLEFGALRTRVAKILKARGVIGGVLIFHGFRYDRSKGWYWSPHFHVLGFILGGYARCRNCNKPPSKCWSCGGFDGRTRREYEKDGYIVKVLGERITVGGTAWYQLNHATLKKDSSRFHVYTWFGCCSYRKLKVTAEYKKNVCPICHSELKRHQYRGKKEFVVAYFSSTIASCGKHGFFDDVPNDWVEMAERRYGYSG